MTDLNKSLLSHLKLAIETDCVSDVLEICQQGLDLNPENWLPPLCTAILQGADDEIVQILLKHGANPRIRNDLPLVCAVLTGNSEVTRELLELGADVNNTSPSTSFLKRWCLSTFNSYECITSQPPDNRGFLLYLAMFHSIINTNSEEMLELLINYGADLTINDYLPMRSCCIAHRKDITNIIDILLAHQDHPPHVLRQVFTHAIVNNNFTVGDKIMGYINLDDELACEILYTGSDENIIWYCLQKLDCTKVKDVLACYLAEAPSNSEVDLNIIAKIIELGVDLQPYATGMEIYGLQYNRNDVIRFIHKYCNMHVVTTKIMNRINCSQ